MSTDTSPVLLVDTSDGVATLTLHRPSARNALNAQLRHELVEAMANADADPDVSVIILTGSDPAFCAGLDLKELGAGRGPVRAASSEDTNTLASGPWAPTTKPVLGAINGVAVTGGFELALCCDFLVASEHAAFGDTHARVGVMPGWGLSVLLPQAIGIRRAVEMSMTGNFMGAHEALQFGLVNRVVPHAELMPVVRRIAMDIAANNQVGVRTLLGSYRAIHTMTVGEGLQYETRTNRQFAATFRPEAVAEQREAIRTRGRNQL
jgi:enoyl-CoA hydratase